MSSLYEITMTDAMPSSAAISKKLRDEGLSAAFLLQVLHLCGSDVSSELLQQVPDQ